MILRASVSPRLFQSASSSILGVLLCLTLSACRGTAASRSPEIRLDSKDGATDAVVTVANLPTDLTRALASTELAREQWTEILRVSVGDGQPAIVGRYAVADDSVRFTPMFPLDPGREYKVVFNAAAANWSGAGASTPIVATIALPRAAAVPSTVVSHVFPSSDVVPENQLRLYIHFSAPMGRSGGLEHVKLFDERGHEVVDPFLPLDAEFWNDDRTRYTVFFDPGRQKRGILPNQQMGRSLEPGHRYTLVVSREWRDGHGLPLEAEYRREFRVGPADERPLAMNAWRVTAPAAGTRDALTVVFDEPLDHGLLLRALGVTTPDGKFLEGDVKAEGGESRWSFTPRQPWTPGAYRLTALAILEDLAGNRIGRAFEVDTFTRIDASPEPERSSLPFVVR